VIDEKVDNYIMTGATKRLGKTVYFPIKVYLEVVFFPVNLLPDKIWSGYFYE